MRSAPFRRRSVQLSLPRPACAAVSGGGAFELPALPYAENALEPHLSARTLQFHYGKHHRAYLDKLNQLTPGTEFAGRELEAVIRAAAGRPEAAAVFNNAAQVWNHTFFWHCMTPGGGGEPIGNLRDRLEADFGSLEAFRQAFTEAALTQFGSGWAWLTLDGGKLKVEKTANADTPLAHGRRPLLTVDVWEHAYYLDYQNRRPDFVQAFLAHLVDWPAVAARLEG